jgi:hypothetical protein
MRTVSRRSAPPGFDPGGGGSEIRTVSFFGSFWSAMVRVARENR